MLMLSQYNVERKVPVEVQHDLVHDILASVQCFRGSTRLTLTVRYRQSAYCYRKLYLRVVVVIVVAVVVAVVGNWKDKKLKIRQSPFGP